MGTVGLSGVLVFPRHNVLYLIYRSIWVLWRLLRVIKLIGDLKKKRGPSDNGGGRKKAEEKEEWSCISHDAGAAARRSE